MGSTMATMVTVHPRRGSFVPAPPSHPPGWQVPPPPVPFPPPPPKPTLGSIFLSVWAWIRANLLGPVQHFFVVAFGGEWLSSFLHIEQNSNGKMVQTALVVVGLCVCAIFAIVRARRETTRTPRDALRAGSSCSPPPSPDAPSPGPSAR